VLEEPVEFGLGKVFDFDSPPLVAQFDNSYACVTTRSLGEAVASAVGHNGQRYWAMVIGN